MPAQQPAMPHNVTVGGLMLEFSTVGEPPARRVKADLIYPNGTRVRVLNWGARDVSAYDLAYIHKMGGTHRCTLREARQCSGVFYRVAYFAIDRIRNLFYQRYSTASPTTVTLEPPARRSSLNNPYGVANRRNMTKSERQELARLVGGYMRGDPCGDGDYANLNDIADHLNASAASESILDSLPFDVRHGITNCDCGHFAAGGSVYHGLASTACDSCVRDGDWVFQEDTGEYAERCRSYWSEIRDGWYSDDVDAEDEDDEDEDDEDFSRAPVRSWATVSTIHLHSPEIESTDKGDFTIGVEFECVPAGYGERDELAQHVYDAHRGSVIAKEDGSLPDHGLELVFAPKTLESAKQTWSRIEFPSGTRAWDAKCCGTHVHIDARAFNRLSIAKFVGFWNSSANAALIRKVAGRHPSVDSQAKQYADIVELGAPAEIIKAVKGGDAATTRYRCVNLTTLNRKTAEKLGVTVTDEHHSVYNTVELRIFRASLKAERTLAQIEMAHASVMFARDGSISGMGEAQFRDWLKRKGQRYPALRTLLGISHHKAKSALAGTVDETVVEPQPKVETTPAFPAAAPTPAATPTLAQVLEATVPSIAASFDAIAREDHLSFDLAASFAATSTEGYRSVEAYA